MAGIDNVGPMLAAFAVRAVAAGAARFKLRLSGENCLRTAGRPLGCNDGSEPQESGNAAFSHDQGLQRDFKLIRGFEDLNKTARVKHFETPGMGI